MERSQLSNIYASTSGKLFAFIDPVPGYYEEFELEGLFKVEVIHYRPGETPLIAPSDPTDMIFYSIKKPDDETICQD